VFESLKRITLYINTMPNRLDATAVSSASANRISGKKVSDAFKKGNNAGMLFKTLEHQNVQGRWLMTH
jgi:hypothetical protein